MTDLKKFADLAASFPDEGQIVRPQHNTLVALVIELSPISGSCDRNFDFTKPEDYASLRTRDLHMLNQIAQTLGTIDDEKSNAVLITHKLNHIFNTVEGAQAMQGLVYAKFPDKNGPVQRSFYVSYGLLEHEHDEWFVKAWREKFGNPPPITADEYLDAAKLPPLPDDSKPDGLNPA